MIVDLKKEDLISLVKGVHPSYSLLEKESELVKRSGQYIGGFVDEWKWSITSLNDFTEEELMELYLLCKGTK